MARKRCSFRPALFSLLFFCGTAVVHASPESAPPASAYAEELVERALQQAVSESPQWLRLGHWRRTARLLGRGFESQADGDHFFMSTRGATDPEAELAATLRAFFVPEAPTCEAEDPDAPPAHAICRFPARFLFLQSALEIDPGRLKVPRCQRYIDYLAQMQPHSATLIFSSYYLNNPSSAFGHTLLRINKLEHHGRGERRDLLDTGIDFGANVDANNALVYAFKGIVGLYPATFRRLPYFYKVRQYGDYESRDLWEYDLALAPGQLEMLVAHLWELGSTYFDYYYFTENCSYHILGVIAAAVPEALLLDRVRSPVIPADTVKTVMDTPGLVGSVGYRPSLRSIFLARALALNNEQRVVVAQLARDAETVIPAAWSREDRIECLDAAADLVDVRYAKELIHKSDPVAAELKRRLLVRRADLAGRSAVLEVSEPTAKAPHRGHNSRRLALGSSINKDANPSIAVDLRFALHDLADPSDGYPDLAQIEMGAIKLRVSLDDKPRFILDDFSIVRIVSLNSVDRFSLLPSWRINFGARTVVDRACNHCEVATAAFGAGIARSQWSERLTLFAFLDMRVEAGHELDGIEGEALRAGFGPAAGMRLQLHPRLNLVGHGAWLWHPEQHPRVPWRAETILRWGLTRDFGMSLEGTAERDDRRLQLMAMFYL